MNILFTQYKQTKGATPGRGAGQEGGRERQLEVRNGSKKYFNESRVEYSLLSFFPGSSGPCQGSYYVRGDDPVPDARRHERTPRPDGSTHELKRNKSRCDARRNCCTI